MQNSELAEHLNQASEPLLLIDGDGAVLWHNLATQRFFKLDVSLRKNELQSYFSTEIIKRIYNVRQYGIIQAKLALSDLAEVEQNLVVCEVGSGSPDSELRLISVKTPSTSRDPFGRYEEFLSTVSHDLKNPIGAIHGYTDVLLDTPAGIGLSQKQVDIISRIRSTSTKIIELIRNYQHLSRMKAESFGLIVSTDPKKADLRSTLQSVIDYTWREGADAPLLLIEIEPALIEVAIERVHLERILANLLSNAIKYTPPRKKISISGSIDKTEVIFRINNEGVPIPSSEIATLFSVFRRGSNRGDKSGQGIGLYIVKSIVEKSQGSINIDSDEKSGTTFTLRLPKL